MNDTEGSSAPIHYIQWEFGHESVHAEAICIQPAGSDCRLSCPHGCESWAIERDHNGKPYHLTGHLEDDGTETLHEMERQDYCNITEFLNADPTLVTELGAGQFVIAQTAIEPVWEGDHYTWKQADA